MEPNSTALLILLFLAAVGGLVLLVRFRNVVLRVGAGLLVLVLATVGGMAVVNDYFGYYQTWSQLSADLTGNYAAFTTTPIGNRADPSLTGKIVRVQLPGKQSHISRSGYVYLPPQYFQPAYAHTRFPVVELLHGTPNTPSTWLVHIHVGQLSNQLISSRRMGPMVLVMPQTFTGKNFTECTNSTHGQDETYLTTDVRHDIVTRFRVTRDPAQWALVGSSSGGYCSTNIGLRQPGEFGAIGAISGYFRPQDGPAARVLNYNPAAENANDPLLRARQLSAGAAPLPSFWLSAGTGNRADIAGAEAFVKAMHGIEQVTLLREPGGGHTYYAFQPAVARVLPWAWSQLAPPDLKVQFPIAGPVDQHSISIHPRHRAVAPLAAPKDRPAKPSPTSPMFGIAARSG